MKLYMHPLSPFSQKAIIAFYEKDVAFDPQIVDILTDKAAVAEYAKIYPLAKIPLLVLDDGWKIPESSIIVEYLDTQFEKGTRLIPKDANLARRVRFHDRQLDLYVTEPALTIFFEGRKPAAERNASAVEKARKRINVLYDGLEQHIGQGWAVGDAFSLADIAAAPALAYASMVEPFGARANLAAYAQRVWNRPSVARVRAAAAPYIEALSKK